MAATEDLKSAYSIRAVERVCAILDLIQRQPDGFSLADVGTAAELPKSSAFRYLATLEEARYVEKHEDSGLFRIGPAFLPLQFRQIEVLVQRARPRMEDLRDRFGETINLAILDGTRVSYLEIVESRRSMRLAARKGDRDPIHCTAVGKAISTVLSSERIKDILAVEGMPVRTERTITDAEAFRQAVEKAQRKGFALDDRENEPDGRCVAVVIPTASSPAALSLSAPSARFPLDEVGEVAEALREVAAEVAAPVSPPS